MAEYINREKTIEDFDKWIDETGAIPKGTSYYYECRACIEDVPAADVVSQAIFDQVKWERDTALATLEEHCIGLAEKADVVEVVRCKECIYYNVPPCPMRLSLNWTNDNDFCSYGEKRDESTL